MSIVPTPARTMTTAAAVPAGWSPCPADREERATRSRPEAVLADKACSHPWTRAALLKRRIRFTSPERCFNRLESSATSPPATASAAYYRSELIIAATILWLR
jgi:hypothetical protein